MRQGSNEATATCRAGAATVCQECGGQKAVTGLLTLTPSFARRGGGCDAILFFHVLDTDLSGRLDDPVGCRMRMLALHLPAGG